MPSATSPTPRATATPSSEVAELRGLEFEERATDTGEFETPRVESPDEEATRLAGENRDAATVVPFPKAPRLYALDATRVLATLGVIWVHVAEVQGHSPSIAALGRFGTSFYVVAVVLFALRSSERHPERPLAEEARFRAERLLVPFAAWSLIYGLFYGFHAYQSGNTFRELATWWGPFAGTARHLWFLPFAFATGLGVARWAPRLRRVSTEWLVFSATVGSWGVFFICYRFLFFHFPRLIFIDLHLHRFDRWIEELPLVFSTTTLVLLSERYRPELRAWMQKYGTWLALVGLGGFVLFEKIYVDWFVWLKEVTSTEGRYLANLAGVSLFLLALGLSESAWVRWLAPLGRYTYFAFLAHVLVLELVGDTLFHTPGYGSFSFAVFSSVGLLAVCLACAVALKKTPLARWLAP